MAKKKKTIMTFLIFLSLVLTVLNQVSEFAEKLSIPIPILLLIILIIYIIWKEEEE